MNHLPALVTTGYGEHLPFFATTVVQGLTLLAGMLSVTGAVLVARFGVGSLTHWVVLLGVGIILLHGLGKYPALALGSKIAMLVRRARPASPAR